MKLGCAIGCFTYPHYSAPYEDAVKKIGNLGFQGLELIAAETEDLDTYYTIECMNELKNIYTGYGMELTEFVLYAHLVTGLMERDPKQKEAAYDIFRKGVDKAIHLGADKINIVSNWPNEMKAPIDYLPCYFHPYLSVPFEPKLKMEMPAYYDAKGAWENYIDSLRKLTEICEDAGLDFVLEGHANVEIGTTDGILRAADHIQSPRFGTNFDTAWQLVQREYLPWSIYKLGKMIKHVHLRDGDGLLCYSLPPGLGIIDWNGVVRALKEVGYNGYLSFEVTGYKEPELYIGAAKTYMENILKAENAWG